MSGRVEVNLHALLILEFGQDGNTTFTEVIMCFAVLLAKKLLMTMWKQVFLQSSGFHRGGYEEFYLQGYQAVHSAESQPTFQQNISP
jgi:hypothetical protein